MASILRYFNELRTWSVVAITDVFSDTQSANTIFSGPATGPSAAPTFRTLVAADTPQAVTNLATAGLATGGPITSTGTVTVTAAAKSDQTTGTSNTLAVTPLHQQDHDSAAKAWVDFTSAATPIINASYNVSSVTKSATGVFVINFTVPFATTSYVCNVTAEAGGTNGWGQIQSGGRATGSVTVGFVTTGPTTFDPTTGNVVCFGRQ